MRRKELEALYPESSLTVLQKGRHKGKLYTRYHGKAIFQRTYSGVIDRMLAIETDQAKGGMKTLNSIAEEFLKARKLSKSAATFADDYDHYERFIRNSPIADKDVTKIRKSDGTAWANYCLKVKPDMKEKYFKNVRGTLNQMLEFAEIEQNPLADLVIHKDHLKPKNHTPDEDQVFSVKERDAVKAFAFTEAKEKHDASYLGIPFLFNTGIRDGELCALHWRDVEGNFLHIRSEMVATVDETGKHCGYKWVDHCKTHAGDRLIPLNNEARRILRDVRIYNLEKGFGISQDDYIFQRRVRDNRQGRKGEITPCTWKTFQSYIVKYCKKAGMKVVKSQHDIRRTFATDLFDAGVKLKIIQKWMGHETVSVTESYIKHRGNDENEFAEIEKLCSSAVSKAGSEAINF